MVNAIPNHSSRMVVQIRFIAVSRHYSAYAEEWRPTIPSANKSQGVTMPSRQSTTSTNAGTQNGTPVEPDLATQIVTGEAELEQAQAALAALQAAQADRVAQQRAAQLAVAMGAADELLTAVQAARQSGDLAAFAKATSELATKAREIAKENAVKVAGSGSGRGNGSQTNPTSDRLDVWITRAWDAMIGDGTFAKDTNGNVPQVTPSTVQAKINELVIAAGFAAGYKPSPGAISNNLEERSNADSPQVEMFSSPVRFAPTT
jgi:hypothetical protein